MLTQGGRFFELKSPLPSHYFMLRNSANLDEKIVPIFKKKKTKLIKSLDDIIEHEIRVVCSEKDGLEILVIFSVKG